MLSYEQQLIFNPKQNANTKTNRLHANTEANLCNLCRSNLLHNRNGCGSASEGWNYRVIL